MRDFEQNITLKGRGVFFSKISLNVHTMRMKGPSNKNLEKGISLSRKRSEMLRNTSQYYDRKTVSCFPLINDSYGEKEG